MRGVRGMSAQETGLYVMLLCRMYEESGPIEDHDLRLSTYCGMRVSVYQKTLDKLVALGKIDRSHGHLFNDRAESEIQSRADDLNSAIKAGKASAKKRQQNQRSGATHVQRPFNHTDTDTDNIDTNVSLGVLDIPSKPSKPKPSHAEIIGILQGILSPDVAQSFMDHRKAKRAPLTANAARMIVKALAGSPDPDRVANDSIMNGWTGVFPEKTNQKGSANGTTDRRQFDAAINETARRLSDGTIRLDNSSRDPFAGR